MSSLPKAVLYYAPDSVWSAVARLAIEEKGYGADEIDYRIVDADKGENYDLTFLRLNAKATLPTLLVPYENSLTEDVESRYKALTDAKSIVEFLDKSRSALSRTHTTSSAPAPSLTPATIEATTTCKVIIEEILHHEIANPDTLLYVNARDDASLKVLAKEVLPALQKQEQVISGYLARTADESVRVSEKVKGLWAARLEEIRAVLAVMVDAETPATELDENKKAIRDEFFRTAHRAWEVSLREVLTQLSKEVVGPFTLGDQISIADLHLAGWLARVVKLVGGTGSDSGETVAKRLEGRVGYTLVRDFKTEQGRRENVEAEQTKIGAFWDGMRERASWRKIYGAGLF
ncbi:hypothetical protein HYPSUDRAFT_196527 [Hypholoma sublateritium FD-334 SS-4]|uniref:GST N-terminal domain-containing protein n=1 Tax=Hypholoma sublateritium (strain FD-334 SS-4) TaxID=945553 RepID=A0A0D2PE97_HYPSF|nr:hypothetical protein HYPSUDRAFT_196527 [Hypholoma sublateritium FD-334 SS-4]